MWKNNKFNWAREFFRKAWWALVPGTEIKLRWPHGWVVLYEMPDGSKVSVESNDPNDHYRPWMKKHVGHQCWDWDWSLEGNDVSDNTLTIKFRKGKEQWATLAALKWS